MNIVMTVKCSLQVRVAYCDDSFFFNSILFLSKVLVAFLFSLLLLAHPELFSDSPSNYCVGSPFFLCISFPETSSLLSLVVFLPTVLCHTRLCCALNSILASFFIYSLIYYSTSSSHLPKSMQKAKLLSVYISTLSLPSHLTGSLTSSGILD